MKIVLLNTSDRKGGAAIACNRLHRALLGQKIDSKFLVQIREQADSNVYEVANTFLKRQLALVRFIIEKLSFISHEKSKDVRFAFSLANTGIDLSKNDIIQAADIIHLHWIYQGYISLNSLKQLTLLNKPLVWTFHDMWAFTGGCHYSGECKNYLDNCGNCHFLKNPKENDISNKIFEKKRRILDKANLTIVTCSNWLKNEAGRSTLFKNTRIEAIPNPIDINRYKPLDKKKIREELGLPTNRFLLGFVSFKVDDERKGFYYLIESLKNLKQNITEINKEIEVVIIGRIKGEISKEFPFKIHFAGTISDEDIMTKYYNSLDVFLCPSMEDNLPNTIMESLACGVPALAFDIGGIGDMIEHKKNGYLAKEKSIEDLSAGLKWIIRDFDRYKELSMNARSKVINNFTNEIVGQKYIKLYNEILNPGKIR